ncbi:MAG: hypothetical protein F6K23_25475 [Okeania sp. SIO2C9]|uniref:hypothetical protein n=1 Tax=Okeania sp. SIO2C9 TaxID=2607791 RepID=UPI0013BF39B9|nr:hypothetical protein [Okeania sp. SIO2C9]NEQ76092.1 hypothetical protein [Okeania sp. SIO2C9]
MVESVWEVWGVWEKIKKNISSHVSEQDNLFLLPETVVGASCSLAGRMLGIACSYVYFSFSDVACNLL